MLFNSLEFIVFFIVVTGLYFVLPHKYRWFLLLVASCLFYMAFIPLYIAILGATIVIDYFAGIYIEKFRETKSKLYTKRFLIASLVANIGVLAVFKYFNFFIDNVKAITDSLGWHCNYYYLTIALPIGLSFHTFQAMSYTIEVYRGNQKAEKHFGIYALYVMFYPQLVAGPIERPQNMLHQFKEEKKFDYNNAKNGLLLILWGLFKKVVIADRLATFVDPVFNNPHNYAAITLLVAAIFFSYQLLCDFSGYSDIALGAAQVMGFKLMKNFDNPYQTKSIAAFWRHWHISLSSWFKDYLYIPLGGNKVATVSRLYFNIFIVFLLSGFWHGANWTFILWGAIHGLYIIIGSIKDKIIDKHFKKFAELAKGKTIGFFNILITFSLVTLALIVFRSSSVANAFYFIKTIFTNTLHDIFKILSTHQISFGVAHNSNMQVAIAFALIFFLEAIHTIQSKTNIKQYLSLKPIYIRWTVYYIMVLSIIFLGVFEKREFIYFQF